ncbi:MAG: helix-turn-helix domain-containing protein [Planctomycetota bacterium]|nr:MAG: helix-turn-helix domain-containing protein [Planctomycetota bacterium]
MDAAAIARLRRRLRLTQPALARILGVHAMTVSKWERGVLRPSRHQLAILDAVARGEAATGAARELADFLNQSLIDVSEVPGMKLSASNQLRGRIVQLEEGPVSARLVIEIAPGVRIVSVITTASVRRLGLRPGKRVVAIIKATEVIVGCK